MYISRIGFGTYPVEAGKWQSHKRIKILSEETDEN